MPPSTNTERIEELRTSFNDLYVQIELLTADNARMLARVQQLEQLIDPLRIENAVLKHEVAELKKSGDEWGRRLWGLIQILIGASIGAGFTYLLKR